MSVSEEYNSDYEYCPKCNADLTMQRGYSNKLAYWTCLDLGFAPIYYDIVNRIKG